MKKHKMVLFLSLITVTFFVAGSVLYFRELRFPDYTSAVYTESTAELINPYIGWYQIYTYFLSDTDTLDLEHISNQESGPGLAMLQFNLYNYTQTPVSDTGLQQLDAVLSAWHSTGKQLILRFLYDWNGTALDKEPESLSLILEHISQTSEIINRYSDCIYILQGIFVGAWGEMHTSNYMDEENMLTLVNHLAAVTDSGIFLAVRTPEQWRIIANSSQPLSAEQAFDGSLTARLSLFNDGMLGSDTDLGTYAVSDASCYPTDFGKRPRQAELLFQNSLCRYVPNGGEVVIANPYNDFASAIFYLADIHVSYLNSDYDDAVLSKWKEDIYQGDGAFHGMNGYDYIARHLGYRYVLRSSAFSYASPWNAEATLSIILENVGFSGCYAAFSVALTLRNTFSGQEFTLPIQTDTRRWDTDSPILLEIPLEIRKFERGTYEIFLNISDPVSGLSIHLANEGTVNGSGCFVGSLTFQKFPQWDFLISALTDKTDAAPLP